MATPDRAPPTVAAIASATAIISFLMGYYFAQARSIGLFGARAPSRPTAKKQLDLASDADSDISDADSQSGDDLGELQSFSGSNEECKLVLVARTDLGMTRGKLAAQCSHATLACYKALLRANPSHPLVKRWERQGQAKVALKVDGEEDLLMLQAQAMSLGLCAQIIRDAGRTQIASGSTTVLGIGPAPKTKVDEVTGHLKLL